MIPHLRKVFHFFFLLVFVILSSCSSSDPESEPADEAPTDMTLEVVSTTTSTATLAWTASSDPDGGSIEYYIEVGPGNLLFGPTAERGITFTELEQGITYDATVIAVDDERDEGYSNLVEFSANDIQPPSSFEITVQSVDHESAVLSWTASSSPNADYIQYDVALFEGDVENSVGVTDGLTFTVIELTANTTYSGIVTAYAMVGNTGVGHTEHFTLTTTDDPNGITMNLQVLEYGFRYARMTFDATSPISLEGTEYDVYLNGEEFALNFWIENKVPGGEFLVEELQGGTEHSFTIRAVRGSQTYMSEPAIFTTPATPANDFEIEAEMTAEGLEISWQRFHGETEMDGNTTFYINEYPSLFDQDLISLEVDETNDRMIALVNAYNLVSGSNEIYLELHWGLNEYYNTSSTTTLEYQPN